MREKSLIIICITILLAISIICGTIIITKDTNDTTNNTTVNNTTDNTTLNNTSNATDNNDTKNSTYTTKTSSSSSSSKSSSKSSSSTNKIDGEEITSIAPSADPDYERVYTKNNKYYRNKKTGETHKRVLGEDGVYYYT